MANETEESLFSLNFKVMKANMAVKRGKKKERLEKLNAAGAGAAASTTDDSATVALKSAEKTQASAIAERDIKRESAKKGWIKTHDRMEFIDKWIAPAIDFASNTTQGALDILDAESNIAEAKSDIENAKAKQAQALVEIKKKYPDFNNEGEDPARRNDLVEKKKAAKTDKKTTDKARRAAAVDKIAAKIDEKIAAAAVKESSTTAYLQTLPNAETTPYEKATTKENAAYEAAWYAEELFDALEQLIEANEERSDAESAKNNAEIDKNKAIVSIAAGAATGAYKYLGSTAEHKATQKNGTAEEDLKKAGKSDDEQSTEGENNELENNELENREGTGDDGG